MKKSNLKNIVVLKNLPSNIVDEAIVILKPTKKIKKIEMVEKSNAKSKKNNFETNKHVLKEAEMLVATYISKLEKREKRKKSNDNLNKKYERLKKYAIIASLILIASIISNFI